MDAWLGATIHLHPLPSFVFAANSWLRGRSRRSSRSTSRGSATYANSRAHPALRRQGLELGLQLLLIHEVHPKRIRERLLAPRVPLLRPLGNR
ncbi:hypothetical protein PG997_001426 [Apiospora hydei]|uniref:Uncharacterized protein n=1 Tax=Apiospora hydei TaxID=1337664 RepID=A0ABR1XDP0_9PEZI